MLKDKSHFWTKAGPLFLVLLIDGMGLGLVFPMLNDLIFDPKGTFLSNTTVTPLMHNVVYGLIVGIFMLSWFFGAAIMGDLSDHLGRKKSLMLCLFGAFLGYLLSAIAVILQSVSLLIVGRIIAGFTSGSQPIAQAAVVDLSIPEHKARNLGLVLCALSLGFILGPLAGGFLSDSRLFSGFNFATPFYFAALISFLNMFLLWLFFHETFIPKQSFKINPYQAIHIFISAFKNENVRVLSVLFFIFIFGWSSFYSFISVFLLKTYDFTATEISCFMALMGLGFGVGNGLIMNYVVKYFSLRTNFIYSTLGSGMIILFMAILHNSLFNWIMVAPVSAFIAIAYTAVVTLFSNQVDENSQGWVMGITSSIMALVWAINGITVGALAAINAGLPIMVAAGTLVFAAACIYLFHKSSQIVRATG